MKKGFTLIELMIVFAIIGIVAAVLVPVFFPDLRKHQLIQKTYSYPAQQIIVQQEPNPNGVSCIDGYKFVNGAQLLDNKGHGIGC